MKSSNIDPVESALNSLLDALAPILISLDVTPLRLAQIARTAFVKASSRAAKKRNSDSPHLAKIASLTGLSRSEVKRIVSANFCLGSLEVEHAPRSLRVLTAWRNLVRVRRDRQLAELKIVGSAPSFESLCKQFSGDIPYRVILDELVQRGCVALIRSRKFARILKAPFNRARRQSDFVSLQFAADFLADVNDVDRILLKRRSIVCVPNGIAPAYAERATVSKVEGLVDHLPKTFSNKQKAGRKRAVVNVYALVARPARNIRRGRR